MTTAYITVGLGFGDEGKGATVHHLVKKTGAKLVVRYSGGCQCAHTVKLDDGRTHTFAQWGAGTFAGAETYLGPQVVVDPVALVKERDALIKLKAVQYTFSSTKPAVTVHPDALLTNPYFMYLNRLKESIRGVDRHGSCGYGIGEARSYALRYGSDAIRASDTQDYKTLRWKLRLLRDRFLAEIAEIAERNVSLDDVMPRMKISPYCIDVDLIAKQFHRSLEVRDYLPRSDEPIVYEGAQGTLLDEWHGFHPNTTWSTVTDEHAYSLVPQGYDIVTIGVTRAFTTRHGAGELPTEFAPANLVDVHNPTNDWQGGFRWGHLDLDLLRYAASCQTRLDAVALTWLDGADKTGGRFKVGFRAANTEWFRCQDYPDLKRQSMMLDRLNLPRYEELPRGALLDRVVEAAGAPVRIFGEGPSESDYHSGSLTF